MKNTLIWTLAIVITLGAVIYQRMTGPTYPKKIKFAIEGKEIKAKLLRSHESTSNAEVLIPVTDTAVKGFVDYKRFPVDQEYMRIPMVQTADGLKAELPMQPPAGKLAYKITLAKNNTEVFTMQEPVVMRFKGEVPDLVLIPHIFFMFIAMFLSTLAGLMALWKLPSYKLYSWLTFFTLLLGGMVLGPLVQLYAFGEAWTGVPFGWDLTDNKTLIAFVFWILALGFNYKKEHRTWVVGAALVLLLVYSVPHSMFGSQLDYSSGQIKTGK